MWKWIDFVFFLLHSLFRPMLLVFVRFDVLVCVGWCNTLSCVCVCLVVRSLSFKPYKTQIAWIQVKNIKTKQKKTKRETKKKRVRKRRNNNKKMKKEGTRKITFRALEKIYFNWGVLELSADGLFPFVQEFLVAGKFYSYQEFLVQSRNFFDNLGIEGTTHSVGAQL